MQPPNDAAKDAANADTPDLEDAINQGLGLGGDEDHGFEYPEYPRFKGESEARERITLSDAGESNPDLDSDLASTNLNAVQTLCFLVIAAFYITLELASPGDLSNNANAVLRGLESLTVDAVTVLFVVTGFLDCQGYYHNPTPSPQILYRVNSELYPHIVSVNLISAPIGMSLHGLWGSAMTWLLNLGSLLYLSPFLELEQESRARLFNMPTSVLMTFLLCRTIYNPVTVSIFKAVEVFPQWHEGVNLANVVLQTSLSCLITTLHLRDNHFYYSFRFILPRLSEYTFGCVCYVYLRARKDAFVFQRVARWLARNWRWIMLLHILLWTAHLGVTYPPHPNPFPLCARAAQGAPCMTRFDAVISRAVPISLIIVAVLPTVQDSTGTIARVSGVLPTASLAMVYQYPVAAVFRLLMLATGWQRVATVFAISSAVAGWHTTLLCRAYLTPRLTPLLDLALDKVQSVLVSSARIPHSVGIGGISSPS